MQKFPGIPGNSRTGIPGGLERVQSATHNNSGEILMSKYDALVTLPVKLFEVFNNGPIADISN